MQFQVSLINTMKNNGHGIIGKVILTVYFILGTASRLQALLSLYESLIMNAYILEKYSPFQRSAVLLSSTLVPFCLHYLGSIALQRYFLGDILNDTVPVRLENALNSLLSCCPLFLDWEALYRRVS